MATAQPRPEHMTLAEFLAWNPGDDTRYELVEGKLVMMNPPKVPHADIADNLATFLGLRLQRPCRALQNVGVLLDAANDTFLEADIAVSCEGRRPNQAHLEAPRLIVEILSPTTQSHDLAYKLLRYWDLPSVEEILYVSSTDRAVRYWHREGEEWRMRTVIGKGALPLRIVGVDLDLDEIYRDVVL